MNKDKIEDVVNEFYIEKLMNYYGVSTISLLAKEIGISKETISSWKKRSSINAIKKKCKELGIYSEIFEQRDKNIHTVEVANIVSDALNDLENLNIGLAKEKLYKLLRLSTNNVKEL